MAKKVDRKTSEFMAEMFSNDFEPPRLGRGPGSDDYAELYRRWLEKLDADFSKFSDDEVARAADVLRRERETRSFPMPGVIFEALKKARKLIESEKPRLISTPATEQSYSAREQTALLLIRSPLGEKAAKEGWIGMLFDFARKEGRLPREGFEQRDCVNEAADFEKRFAECVRGDGGAMGKALENLGQSFLERREALRAYVLERKPYTWGTA